MANIHTSVADAASTSAFTLATCVAGYVVYIRTGYSVNYGKLGRTLYWAAVKGI